ncbi:MAG: spore germination protein [Bacillota bacterium]
MFNMKKFKFLQFLMTRKKPPQKKSVQYKKQQSSSKKLTPSLAHNLNLLKDKLGSSSDVVYHNFTLGIAGRPDAAIISIDGLTDKTTIHEFIIKPLIIDSRTFHKEGSLQNPDITEIKNTLISVGGIEQHESLDKLVEGCLSGDTILLIDGLPSGLTISSRGWKSRGIEEPNTEAVVRGPREGFVETLRTNTALIRRRLKNPDLTIESFTLGQRTRTDIAVVYLKNIVKPGLIEEIRNRLNRIKADAILESGYIEQFIEDAPFSPFSTVANSERPDVVAAKLLEGRAAIIIDGSPMVLTVPMLFIESFHSAEDYYSRPFYVSIVRMLRFVSFFISVFGPATYVALTTYHQELIPTALVITMAAAREGTPFPAVLEAILMGISFEILREAGIRLPRPVGTAISIVGALVIGEAVVSAGLIGAPMVIVVALTAISSFVVPPQADVGGVGRIGMVFAAGVLGAFGVMIGFLGGLVHLCSLRSFGTPYLAPLAPLKPLDLKDTFFRLPLWTFITRPGSIASPDMQRQEIGMMPAPPQQSQNGESDK